MQALIITRYNYPNGDAGAVRQQAIGDILYEKGYDVHIIGVGNHTQITEGCCKNTPYTQFPKRTGSVFKKGWGLTVEYPRYLKQYLNSLPNTPDIIVVTRLSIASFLFVKKYASSHNIPVFHDCVEWFSFNQIFHSGFSIGMLIEYITASVEITKLSRGINIISISSYLDDYFIRVKRNSYRLPVIMDVNSHQCIKYPSSKFLNILYAGSPASKDYVVEILDAMLLLNDEERRNIKFTLLGISEEQLKSLCNLKEEEYQRLTDSLQPMGRVPRDTVLEHLKATDFSVIIRSSTARYAKAGFPTKSVEALMSGTSLFLNMTSDLGMYLKDGYDCIEVENETPEAIAVALRRALALTPEEKDQMKKNARKTAEDNFDYRLYIESFGQFIQNAK